MDIVKWDISDIVSDNEYTGKIINGMLILNNIQDSLFYAKKDSRLYIIDFETKNIKGVGSRTKLFNIYKNPYINIKNNITVIFTRQLNEIYIDTDNYYKVKDILIRLIDNRAAVSNSNKTLKSIIFGDKEKHSKEKNGIKKDIRGCNLELIRREKLEYYNKGSKNIKELKKFNNGEYHKIKDIKGVVSNDKLEGKALGNIQVLNKIDDNHYYVRVEDSGEYYLAIESEEDILRKRMRLVKRNHLREYNPYIELRDGTVLIYTTTGYVVKVDSDVYYSKIKGNKVYVQKRGHETWKYSVSIKNIDGVRLTLAEYLGILSSKYEFVGHKNGYTLDFRKDNIVVVNRLGYRHRLMDHNRSIRKVGDKYVSRIRLDGKNIVLGSFNTKEEATNVRKEALEKYWGK